MTKTTLHKRKPDEPCVLYYLDDYRPDHKPRQDGRPYASHDDGLWEEKTLGDHLKDLAIEVARMVCAVAGASTVGLFGWAVLLYLAGGHG